MELRNLGGSSRSDLPVLYIDRMPLSSKLKRGIYSTYMLYNRNLIVTFHAIQGNVSDLEFIPSQFCFFKNRFQKTFEAFMKTYQQHLPVFLMKHEKIKRNIMYFETSNRKGEKKKRGKPPGWNLDLHPPLKVGPVARCPVGGGLSDDKCVSTSASEDPDS